MLYANCCVLFKVEVRYNLPSSRGEICKFHLTTKVVEIKENEAENLFGPVEDQPDEDEDKDKGKDKDKEDEENKGGIKECKKLKNKKKKKECRKKAREAAKGKDKDKDKGKDKGKGKDGKKNRKPPPKHQPVKSIHLKVCTR